MVYICWPKITNGKFCCRRILCCCSTGNPLSFHPKHRVKSTECLSNLINPSSFRLDGKKLSGSERKAVPRSLTHYPGSSPSISSQTTASDSPHHHALTPPPSSQLMSRDSPTHQSDTAVTAKVSQIHTNASHGLLLHAVGSVFHTSRMCLWDVLFYHTIIGSLIDSVRLHESRMFSVHSVL